jgi:tripartite-type tricarboxylate transporter receptor subunit TctC
MRRRHCLGQVLAGAAAPSTLIWPARAQANVTKLVFQFGAGAGGGGDTLSRIIAEQIGPLLGRTIMWVA